LVYSRVRGARGGGVQPQLRSIRAGARIYANIACRYRGKPTRIPSHQGKRSRNTTEAMASARTSPICGPGVLGTSTATAGDLERGGAKQYVAPQRKATPQVRFGAGCCSESRSSRWATHAGALGVAGRHCAGSQNRSAQMYSAHGGDPAAAGGTPDAGAKVGVRSAARGACPSFVRVGGG